MGLGLKVDGRPGKLTKSAIKSFQQRSGLVADGSLGAKTEAALIKAGAPPPPISFPSSPSSAGKTAPWVSGLLPLLECYRGDIPLDFLIGWIAVETGGCVGDISRIDERGYFQIHPDELKNIKLKVNGQPAPVDRERLATDPEYSVRAGIALVRYYMGRAESVLKIKRGTDLFWPMVKFQHTGTGFVQRFLGDMRRHGKSPTTWAEVRRYAEENRDRLKSVVGYDPVRLVENVDHLFEKARLLTPRPGGGSLKVVTTNLLPGYLRKNGVPYSDKTDVEEYYDYRKHPNGDEWFTVTTVVRDPVYLYNPFVTSSDFKKEPDGSKFHPTPCEAR
jgi:hypothetical protein